MAKNTYGHENELEAAARLHQQRQQSTVSPASPAEPAEVEQDNLPAVLVAAPMRTTPPALGLDYLPDAGELQRLERLADLVSRAGMVPASYRSQIASDGRILQDRRPNVLVAALMGRTFGWDLLTAMRNIHVIEGAATLKPEALLGLVRARGHRVRIIRGTDQVTVHGQRVDTGDEQTATFTFQDAYRAGLAHPDDNGRPRARSSTGKPLPWEQYPLDMCQWRAVAILARGLFSDIALGLSYTPEELGAVVDAEGAVIVESAAMPEPTQQEREQQAPPPRPSLQEALQQRQDWRQMRATGRAQQADLSPQRAAQGHAWDAVRAYRPNWTEDEAQQQVADELVQMTGDKSVTPRTATAEQLHALAEEYEDRADRELRASYEETK